MPFERNGEPDMHFPSNKAAQDIAIKAPTVGEAYRPFKLFNGGVVPISLASSRDLSPGAKLLFAELGSILGRNGFCRPSLAHLAKRLGASEDKITRWLRELTDYGLIKARRRGPGTHA